MRMYDKREVKYIVEAYLSELFGFASLTLDDTSEDKLDAICSFYGTEVSTMSENK